MELTIKDMVRLLELPEKTVLQWARDKKIPAYKIKNQYYFTKAEINEWVLQNNIPVSASILDLKLTTKPVSISELIEKGGMHSGIKGSNVFDVIKNVIKTIPVPPETTREVILSSLLEREEMMTTAIGHGIAIPHPRNPIIADVESEKISLCFLQHEVDFKALDGVPVHTLFVIFSSNSKRHLEILSKISYLCQREELRTLFGERAKPAAVLALIKKIEMEWDRK